MLVAGGLLASGPSAGGSSVAGGSSASVRERPAVVEHRVIGHTVHGRALHAWRVGDPDARVTAVVMAAMHGDETAPQQILRSLRDGAPVEGVDLWLLPAVNADGVARGTRTNARGVDLNRNFPHEWAELDGRSPARSRRRH